MTDLDRRPDEGTDWSGSSDPAGADAGASGAALGDDNRRALIRLAVAVVAGAAVFVYLGWGPAALVVALFFVMIMVHELGHFVMAKRAGMKVTEYFVGFGPRLWSVRKGETEYGVKALPFGGYCKIIGMTNVDPEVDPADEPRTYRQQSYPKRLSVAVAGSVMHFVMAFIMLLALNAFVGNPDRLKVQPVVEQILAFKDGPNPAQQAGIQPGDRILAVDGRPVKNWDRDAAAQIQASAGRPLQIRVARKGSQLDLTAVPADLLQVNSQLAPADQEPAQLLPDKAHAGFLGITATASYPTTKNPLVVVGRSAMDLGRDTKFTLGSLVSIFSFKGISGYTHQLASGGSSSAKDANNRFLSPVGLVRVSGVVARGPNGVRHVLGLLILINVFVGVFNMAPMLPFDGGHVVIATYERIRSRKSKRYFADVAKMLPAVYAVVAVMAFIFLSSTYLDIFHWNF
jgi:membrane-associated protease RseP (regulator of RpoE activity)